MTGRFPALLSYQGEMNKWWQNVQVLIQRDLAQIQAQFTADETAAASSLKNIQAQLTSINATVSSLAGMSTGPTAAQFKAISDSVQAISALLAEHIKARAAHGTQSQVVGESDQEDLNQKRIGLNAPGYGRFAPSIGYNRIFAGQTVNIGVNDFMIVAGTFTVDGILNIAGTLVAL